MEKRGQAGEGIFDETPIELALRCMVASGRVENEASLQRAWER